MGVFSLSPSRSPSWSSRHSRGGGHRSLSTFPALTAWKVHAVINYIWLGDILATVAEILSVYPTFCAFGVIPAARQHCFKGRPFSVSSPKCLGSKPWARLLSYSAAQGQWGSGVGSECGGHESFSCPSGNLLACVLEKFYYNKPPPTSILQSWHRWGGGEYSWWLQGEGTWRA